MTSSNLSLTKLNGNLTPLNSVTSSTPLGRRFSVSSMSQSDPIRTPGAFLNQYASTRLEPTKEENGELAAPDMILKHGKISGLTWWCTFKDSQLERLYRKFFYLDAHFHFQFLGLANIVWDILQIFTFFGLKKYQFVGMPISREEFNTFTCRSSICHSNQSSNFSNCEDFINNIGGHSHIVTPDERSYEFYHYGALPRLIIHFTSLMIFVSLAIVWQLDRHPPTRRRRAYALLLWFILCLINYSLFAISPYHVPDDEVGFTQFIIFMTYTLIPVPLFWSLGLAVILSVFHMMLITIFAFTHPQIDIEMTISRELTATFIILIAANMNGFYHNTLYELSARRIFLTIRDSAKACIKLDIEYGKMEYLLLSIMPKYFYEKYEFGVKDPEERNSNFKKLHMDHVEDASILFADIVGFTKISSSMEPRELVSMLNALFGEFDDLAKQNKCLRIKILGDCYYCVSGVPDKIPNHADNCVNMGLDMCETIKKFQRDTFPELKMRVGVHTGHVFSGILGAKKFQFDIWSTDVTIANHLESSGVPGCVHISDRTKNCLIASYDMIEGEGSHRDNLLQHKNISTYIIRPEEQRKTRSLRLSFIHFKANAVPFSKQSIDMFHKKTSPSERRVENVARVDSRRRTLDSNDAEDLDTQIKQQIEESLIKSKHHKNDSETEKRGDNFSIDNTHSLLNPFLLVFTQLDLEIQYLNLPDKSFKYYIISSWIVHVAILIVQLIVHTHTTPVYFFVAVSVFLAILDSIYWMYLLEYIERVPKKLKPIKRFLAEFSNWMIGNIYMRYIVSFVVIVLVMVSATINLSSCCAVEGRAFKDRLCNDSIPLADVWNECPAFNQYFDLGKSKSESCVKCINPQYFIYNAILAMLVPSMFIGLNWIYKAIINTMGFIIYVTLHLETSTSYFRQWDDRHSGICTPEAAYISLIERGVYWILIEFLALVMFERLTERTNRIGFIWRYLSKVKNELHKQANEEHTNLLHNILPKHVAKHFLGDEQASQYSQKHSNACVMFASIPGFETLYSEDDINHRGKEWLRLLNEMFHEFDTLLENKEFEGVEKIKTIGSTYMAATGLNENGTDDSSHITTMARFTFALREKLRELSDHAFNDFQFRIGINTGPVVAGVIGAEKPLFDIWGDTVNVASRMESTGETGKTQVTEKVAKALMEDSFELIPRGKVFCKGKGELDVFLLVTPESYYV